MSQRNLDRLILALGAMCLAILVWAAFASRGASVRPDELGFLLNGWVITGHKEILLGSDFRSFYTAGFGVITAVAALIGRNIGNQYRLSVLANIGICTATAAVLARLAFRHLAASRRSARTLAIIVALGPAVAANSLFAWSESLNRFLFVAVALFAYEHVRHPRWWTSIGIAVTSSFMVIAHGRFTLLPALTVLLLVIVALFGSRSREAVMIAVAGVAATVVSYWAFTRVNVWLRGELYPAATGKEGRMVDKFTNLSNLPSLGRSATGQLWYVLATSFGLAAVGLAVNVRTALVGMRRPRNLQWLAPTFVFGAAGSIAFASALQLLRVIRPDHLIYGRYLEAVSPLFVMLGLCAVTTGSGFARRAWFAGIGAACVCAGVLAAAAGRDELRAMTIDNKFFAIPNAIAVDWALKLTKPAGYLSLTFSFAVIGLALLFVAKRTTTGFLAVLAVLSVGFTTFTAARTVVPYRDYFDQMVLDDAIEAATKGDGWDTTILLDSGGVGGQIFYDYRYLVHPIQVDRADVLWVDRAPLRCVIGVEERRPEDTGWEIIARENDAASRGRLKRGNIVLWKRTGVDSC